MCKAATKAVNVDLAQELANIKRKETLHTCLYKGSTILQG